MHQPNFMPWAGFFHRMQIVDLFILMDNVQYSEGTVINRVKVRNKDGWQWLTVPVLSKGRQHQLINEVEMNSTIKWPSSIWKALELNYRKAPFWGIYGPPLKDVFNDGWTKLFDLNFALLKVLCKWLGINTEIELLSSIPHKGNRTDLLVNVAQILGANVFVTGEGCRSYLANTRFQEAGIALEFPNFQSPIYQQCYPGFEAGLSAIDILMCCGPESLEIIMNAQGKKDQVG
jgi:hypothetical protein